MNVARTVDFILVLFHIRCADGINSGIFEFCLFVVTVNNVNSLRDRALQETILHFVIIGLFKFVISNDLHYFVVARNFRTALCVEVHIESCCP